MRPQLGAGGGRGQAPGPPGMPTLADPLAWDFRSPDCERRGFCRVRPPACSKPSQQSRGAGRLVCLGSLDRGPSSGSVTADTALPGEGPPFGVCTWLERSAESPASIRRTGLCGRHPASGSSPSTGGSHALALSLHLCGVWGSVHTHRYPAARGNGGGGGPGSARATRQGALRAASLGALLARAPRMQTPCRRLVRLKSGRCRRLREGATASSPGGPRGRAAGRGLWISPGQGTRPSILAKRPALLAQAAMVLC